MLHPTCVDHHATDWVPYAPGLMIRPAARIVRELPPRLASYRVAVSLRAAPLAAPISHVRSTAGRGMGMKKAIKSDPGGKTRRFVSDALPHSGSESGLMAFVSCLVSTPCKRIISTSLQDVSRLFLEVLVWSTRLAGAGTPDRHLAESVGFEPTPPFGGAP